MAIDKVRKYFAGLGIEDRIIEFEVSSATVDKAAAAAGVEPARICKTLAFEDPQGGCILIETAGDARVNNGRYKRKFGAKPRMLAPDEVLSYTGHAVGGVCAFAIENKDVKIYADISLQRFSSVFPACGSDNSAVEMSCEELFKYSEALEWIDVCRVPEEEQ